MERRYFEHKVNVCIDIGNEKRVEHKVGNFDQATSWLPDFRKHCTTGSLVEPVLCTPLLVSLIFHFVFVRACEVDRNTDNSISYKYEQVYRSSVSDWQSLSLSVGLPALVSTISITIVVTELYKYSTSISLRCNL